MHTIEKVGITGAAGNIGSTLIKGLENSYTLSLYDIHSIQSNRHSTQRVDFAESEELKGLFDGLDALIHLAGNPDPSASYEETYRNNFVATSLLFEEAKRSNIKKIVFASSNFYHQGDIGKVLQGKKRKPIYLEDNPTPLSTYGKSKLFGEQLGENLSHLGISFTALRIGWTIPEDTPRYYDTPYMRAMFCSHRDLVTAFKKALQSSTPFTLGFAISNNSSKIFDLKGTKEQIGFIPEDNSSNY